uniref:procollagen-proline 4-dioxygenase n=1 Tax=Kalanchoe fedtschenkoi TaxID=63787 RepID=A0A7N0V1A4_KALFE
MIYFSIKTCWELIQGTGGLKKSRIIDDDGNSVQSKFRTSSGSFLALSQDEMVAEIEKRIATWTFLPPENGENMQILRYELHEYYVLHRDYYMSSMKMTRTLKGGNRLATVLMYLSNVTKGGETIFPQAQGYLPRDDAGDLSECAKEKGGLSVKPFKGDALLFFNLHPNATGDPRTLHGSCPVVEGEKWVATKWIRERGNYSDACEEDANEECPELAARGECERNPFYMVGFNGTAGNCMKSCGACGDGESSSSS